MTMYWSRIPCWMSCRITFPWFGAVVVRSADMATMSGWRVLISSTKRSTLTLTPRSTTEKPFADSMVQTIRLPMSWMSPCTVQARTLPWFSRATALLASSGSRMARAAFIASALITSSGRNSSPAPNRSPTTRIPFTNPLSIDSSGAMPSSRDWRARAAEISASPMITLSAIFWYRSSWLKAILLNDPRRSDDGARRHEFGLRRPQRGRSVVSEPGRDLGAGIEPDPDETRELVRGQARVGPRDADRGDGVAVSAPDGQADGDQVILELAVRYGVALLADLDQVARQHLRVGDGARRELLQRAHQDLALLLGRLERQEDLP